MMQKSHQQRITEGNIWLQLLIFFFPILLGTLFQQMYNTVDTVIVGRVVGTTALAAVGCTGALLNMVNGFFIGVSSGATVIVSQFCGAEDREQMERSIHTGVTLSVILGMIITVFGIGFGPWILVWMQTPAECLADATTYLRVIFAGAIGSMVYNMGAGILRAMGDSRRPMLFLMATCVMNILLDILLVAVLHMGVVGAALATAISQWVSAVLPILTLTRKSECPLRFEKLGIDIGLLRRILLIGVPAGLQLVTFDFANILIQSGINSFGDIVVAAWTTHGKMDAITWMISGAFGVSVTTFVGQNFGAQKYQRIRQSVWICMAMSVFIIGLLSFLMVTFRYSLIGIFTADPEVIQVGAFMCLSIVPFNAIFMPVEVFAGTMRGTGYSIMPTIITGTCACLFRVLWLVFVVSRWHTLQMLMLCYPISWVLSAIVFFIGYLRGTWLHKRIAECGMEPEKPMRFRTANN